VQAKAEQFTRNTISEISQAGLDLTENMTVFVGGGSILVKDHIIRTGLVAKTIFVYDVHANTKGYQLLYENQSSARSQRIQL
jgi:plasmid segregation protein ParM